MVEKSDSERQHREEKKREKANETKTNDSSFVKSRPFFHFATTKFMDEDFAQFHMQSFTTNDVQHSRALFVAFGSVKPVTAPGANLGFLL